MREGISVRTAKMFWVRYAFEDGYAGNVSDHCTHPAYVVGQQAAQQGLDRDAAWQRYLGSMARRAASRKGAK